MKIAASPFVAVEKAMALQEIEIDQSSAELSPDAAAVIEEANRRIDDFFETERNRRFPLYLPSDPHDFYRALSFITKNDLPLGRVFCEWGSGFGLATCLASVLGYEAYGLEVEPELAQISRDLAHDLGLEIEIIEANYVPDGLEEYEGVGGTELVKPMTIGDRRESLDADWRYDGMELSTAEIDVFFVFPKPIEQEFMRDLFDIVSVEGAILIAYQAEGDVYAFRKVYGRGDRLG